VHTLVVWGDPAAEICRVAQERQSDLIAISTHGRTGRELEFIGSVADAVVRRAPCAVLLLRAGLFAAAEG
jgi:nucleotide-binding universal stress UspA family protein